MTLYLNLPGDRGKLDRLVSEFGAVVLPGPPRGMDAVPPDKALVCVADAGEYEAPGYIITETDFANWIEAGDEGMKTWLLMDRDTADSLCPGAAEDRQRWQEGMESDAEAAAHTDNLVPVARVSRWALGFDAGVLRRHAEELGGPTPPLGPGGWPEGVTREHIVAADLISIATKLESWAERDWIAVIDIGPGREQLDGPLPPFPGPTAG